MPTRDVDRAEDFYGKTLAGQAGISKEIRDRIQNHTLQDVSSKSYDRWSYMPEKRAAMEVWDKFVRAILENQSGREGFDDAPIRAVANSQ